MARRKKEVITDKDAPEIDYYDYTIDKLYVDPADLCAAVSRAGHVVYDLETTSLSPRDGKIEGVAFYVPPLNGQKELRCWFPYSDNTMVHSEGNKVYSLRPAMDQQDTMEKLRPIFEDMPDVIKTGANQKFDQSWLLLNPGTDRPIRVNGRIGDSMLADYAADERRYRYGLKYRVEEEFNIKMTTYEEASKRQGVASFMNQKPLGSYASSDCYWTYQLHEKCLASIRQQDPSGKLEKVYWDLDMKLLRVILEMEVTGVAISFSWYADLRKRLDKEKNEMLAEIIQQAGWAPNLRSPKQVSEFLYGSPEEGGLGLPTEGLEQNEVTGAYSTSEAVIKHFGRKNRLVRLLLDYRSLEVIDRSFCKKLMDISQATTRIYTNFHQTGTVTSRLSSSRPINLQNFPRDKNLIRRGVVAKLPEDKNSRLVLLDGDFSQIELRLAGHYSCDKNLLEVYTSTGTCQCDRFLQGYECSNPDKSAKCKWEGLIPPTSPKICPSCKSDKVTWQERCRHVDIHQRTAEDVGVPRNPLAKNCNFSMLYRVGAPKFAVTADLYTPDGEMDINYARELIDKWMNVYSGIPQWHWRVEEEIRKNNWRVTDILGRIRRLDDEKKFNEYSAITQGINFKIQATAQELIKLGMLRTYDERNKKIANSQPEERKLWETFKFIAQVHDEVLFQVDERIVDEAKVMVKNIMENIVKLRCKLIFSIKFGENWENAH